MLRQEHQLECSRDVLKGNKPYTHTQWVKTTQTGKYFTIVSRKCSRDKNTCLTDSVLHNNTTQFHNKRSAKSWLTIGVTLFVTNVYSLRESLAFTKFDSLVHPCACSISTGWLLVVSRWSSNKKNEVPFIQHKFSNTVVFSCTTAVISFSAF